MAISPQRITIYLYSAQSHRAVIFAIAQLSCCVWHQQTKQCNGLQTENKL